MEQFNRAVFILITVLLSGCGPLEKAVNPYEEEFKCRATDDTGKCIDTPRAYEEARYPRVTAQPEVDRVIQQGDEVEKRYQMVAGLLEEPKKPLLQPPKILRVLLLPYKGEGEELFMARYVYLKVKEADWVLSDINENEN